MRTTMSMLDAHRLRKAIARVQKNRGYNQGFLYAKYHLDGMVIRGSVRSPKMLVAILKLDPNFPFREHTTYRDEWVWNTECTQVRVRETKWCVCWRIKYKEAIQ